MTIKFSAFAAKQLLGHSVAGDKSLRILCGASATYYIDLIICQGSVPLYPESPVSSSDVLATFTDIKWAASSSVTGYTAYLAKHADVWTCSSVAVTGIATYFRIFDGAADNGYQDDLTDKARSRIQGTVGEDTTYDLVVADAYYVAATSRTIDNFRIYLF